MLTACKEHPYHNTVITKVNTQCQLFIRLFVHFFPRIVSFLCIFTVLEQALQACMSSVPRCMHMFKESDCRRKDFAHLHHDIRNFFVGKKLSPTNTSHLEVRQIVQKTRSKKIPANLRQPILRFPYQTHV